MLLCHFEIGVELVQLLHIKTTPRADITPEVVLRVDLPVPLLECALLAVVYIHLFGVYVSFGCIHIAWRYESCTTGSRTSGGSDSELRGCIEKEGILGKFYYLGHLSAVVIHIVEYDGSAYKPAVCKLVVLKVHYFFYRADTESSRIQSAQSH